MAFATDVGSHFVTAGQTHAANLTQSRVRLFRRGGIHTGADTATLRATLQSRNAALFRQLFSRFTNQLIYSGHSILQNDIQMGASSPKFKSRAAGRKDAHSRELKRSRQRSALAPCALALGRNAGLHASAQHPGTTRKRHPLIQSPFPRSRLRSALLLLHGQTPFPGCGGFPTASDGFRDTTSQCPLESIDRLRRFLSDPSGNRACP